MSGYEAFASFVNYLKGQLAGSGISVVTKKEEIATPPYLLMQEGPQVMRGDWLAIPLCQGWLVVEKINSEELVVTAGKKKDLVIEATKNAGTLPKYDYSTTPKTLIGGFIPKIMEITGDMSSDPLRSGKVITWKLFTTNI